MPLWGIKRARTVAFPWQDGGCSSRLKSLAKVWPGWWCVPLLPVEAPEVPRRGSHGWLVLAIHGIVPVTKELLPWGPVALGDGSDVELLMGDFFEGARVPCAVGETVWAAGATARLRRRAGNSLASAGGGGLGRPLSRQQLTASSPTLLRSQHCGVWVQAALPYLGPGHWGSGLCSCARPSLISWVLLGGHPGVMLPHGARSDNSPGPQHSPLPVEGRVNRHRGELPLPQLELRGWLKAPQSFLHLLTVCSFTVLSESLFPVWCEPPAPCPGSCRRQ